MALSTERRHLTDPLWFHKRKSGGEEVGEAFLLLESDTGAGTDTLLLESDTDQTDSLKLESSQ